MPTWRARRRIEHEIERDFSGEERGTVAALGARMSASPPQTSAFERLMHRWFVQYNPLYLASATLVLVGLTLLSRGLAGDLSLAGQLLPGAAAELYAYALIGAAALLMRLDLPRPATFVALLAVLYQGDLALGTETYGLLGETGKLASALWLASFVAKLFLLARAMRLRPSRSALAVAALGALGPAIVPHLARALRPDTLAGVIGLWLFAVLALALWTERAVDSTRALDAWGSTVKRRALIATWSLWGTLAGAHVACWIAQYNLSPAFLAPVALLLATRWIRGEARVLACVAGALGFVVVAAPSLLAEAGLLSATTLVLGALRRPTEPIETSATPTPETEYRGSVATPTPSELRPRFERAPERERRRMLAWAGYALYLAAWQSFGLPDHAIALEFALGAAMLPSAWRARSGWIPLPLAATWAHWAVRAGVVRAPRSTLQWGLTTLSLGFALLAIGLVTSWRLRDGDASDPS
jgi:hypothetical protein